MKFRLAPREAMLIGAGSIALGTAAYHGPASASTPVVPHALSTAAYAASVSGGYVLGADNTNATNPFNDYAIEGKVDNDVGGVGVLGYGQQAKSYGVYGVTFGLNGIGVYGAGIAATPAPGTTPNAGNVTTGIVGDSHSGDGAYGSTEWAGDADPFANPVAGVYGVDDTKTGEHNDGVFGGTTEGGFGVAGYSMSGALGGVGGESIGDAGVTGMSTNGAGVEGMSSASFGLIGISTDTGTYFPNDAAVGAFGTFASLYARAGTTLGSGTISYPIIAQDNAEHTSLFSVDNSGNTKIYGNLAVHGSTSTYIRTRNAEVRAESYTPAVARPSAEDFGEAQMTNGVGFVHLDPSFAQSIDDRTPYLVVVTPEGDTNGVYVTGKSLTGFTVRENKGGRSTVAFGYRIVASRYGEGSSRMALVTNRDLATREAPVANASQTQHLLVSAKVKAEFDALRTRAARPFFVPRPNLAVEHRLPR